jgi:hypothetical protein
MSKLQAGNWVEVRTKDEILSTLDERGRLDGLPFMPQMFQYCGKRFRVYKRAHKTCDTIAWNWDSPGRKLPDGIHLNLRCDGEAYGGCQAACLIFWKEAWLKPCAGAATLEAAGVAAGSGCSEADVVRATRVDDPKAGGEARYACQATELLNYTRPLPWWDARQYWEDYTSGNATLGQMLRGFVYVGYYYGSLAFKRKLGGPSRWLYDRVQALWGGLPFPRYRGMLPADGPTPLAKLNLKAGDLVRVKSYEEILATLDTDNKNRGMAFDAELVPYCGEIHRVRGRVERFIDERTGYLKKMKTPAVILEGAYCRARYSNHRMFCPRSIYSWWREVWLERVSVDPLQEIALPVRDRRPCPFVVEELRAQTSDAPVSTKRRPSEVPSNGGREHSRSGTRTAS